MPTLKCPECEKEWWIPGSFVDFKETNKYKHVLCPYCEKIVHFAEIVRKIP